MTRARTPLWIGTYPAAGAGTAAGLGEGVWRAELDPETGTIDRAVQLAVTPAPSFLAAHPSGRVLYAVGEVARGTVTAFTVTMSPQGPAGPGLEALDTVGSGGADPCHLLLAPDARTLYVANYSSGTVGVLPLDADGRFSEDVRAAGGPVQVLGHTGAGPDASRQEGPHAHFVALAPGGDVLLVVDLGTDELRRYARDRATGLLTEAGIAATLPPGTGPRHLVFSADGRHAYVVGELAVTVAVLAWDPVSATGALVQTMGVEPAGPTRSDERPLPSHVELVDDRLLVAVRGTGTLAVAVVGPDGLLAREADVLLAGPWPRHFAVVDRRVVVAEQVAGHLEVLAVGGAPGSAGEHPLALVSPACVVVGPPVPQP